MLSTIEHDSENYQRRVDLGDGWYAQQAVAAQGGDYDLFTPSGNYIGSRETEAIARRVVQLLKQQQHGIAPGTASLLEQVDGLLTAIDALTLPSVYEARVDVAKLRFAQARRAIIDARHNLACWIQQGDTF